jgi:RNA polymerase sigma-B factor
MTADRIPNAAIAPRHDGDEESRGRLIVSYLPLVRGTARRFAGRGEPFDDLVQVGTLGVIAAVDRCDPSRADQLTAYVRSSVEGEIRRHLRDRATVVRIPRRLQSGPEPPGPALSLDDDDPSFAAPAAPDEVGVSRALVASAARSLDGRERRIVALRFYADMSQAEIGELVGMSQVHVSRLLQRATDKMRARLQPGAASS